VPLLDLSRIAVVTSNNRIEAGGRGNSSLSYISRCVERSGKQSQPLATVGVVQLQVDKQAVFIVPAVDSAIV